MSVLHRGDHSPLILSEEFQSNVLYYWTLKLRIYSENFVSPESQLRVKR
jgi:hypothetical protein